MNTLIEMLVYDETSPSGLRWNVTRRCGIKHNRVRVDVGDVAGHLESNGYWRVGLDGRKFANHRVIFYMIHKELPEIVDHIDGNSANNSISNLRASNNTLNQRNRKLCKSSVSGKTGVSLYEKFIKGRLYRYWRATWRDLNGKPHEKYFRIKDSSDAALSLAKDYRDNMISELNTESAGYTDRHTQNTPPIIEDTSEG